MESKWVWNREGIPPALQHKETVTSSGAKPLSPLVQDESADQSAQVGSVFLHHLGVHEGVVVGLDEGLLKCLDAHFRDYMALARECELLRTRAHSDAVLVQSLDNKCALIDSRFKDELKESGRLLSKLDQLTQETRLERAKTLKETVELKKAVAKLSGVDATHLAAFRRLEVDHDKLKEKLAKAMKGNVIFTGTKSHVVEQISL
jgi:hypothetical protein